MLKPEEQKLLSVCIIGKPNAGKSTLLNIITSQLKPDAGTVDTGETTVFGYYKQGGLTFDPKERVIDIVKSERCLF